MLRKQILLFGKQKISFRLKSKTILFLGHNFASETYVSQFSHDKDNVRLMLISFHCHSLIKKYFLATMGALQPPILLRYLYRTLSPLFFSANLYLGLFLSSSTLTVIIHKATTFCRSDTAPSLKVERHAYWDKNISAWHSWCKVHDLITCESKAQVVVSLRN